jgi:hypothetical protein
MGKFGQAGQGPVAEPVTVYLQSVLYFAGRVGRLENKCQISHPQGNRLTIL